MYNTACAYIIHNSYISQVEFQHFVLHPKLKQQLFWSNCFLCGRSPVLRRQAMLSGSCSQLEAAAAEAAASDARQQPRVPEFRVHPSTPQRQGAASASSAAGKGQSGGQGSKPLFFRRKAGRSERAGPRGRGASRDGPPRLQRSHSEPGLGSSTDTGEAVGKGVRIFFCQTLALCLNLPLLSPSRLRREQSTDGHR